MLSDDEWQTVRLSVLVAAAATISSLPFGIALAHQLARPKMRGKVVIETLVNLPLVMPPIVTGYLLLLLFGRRGVLGGPLHEHLGLSFTFNWKGAALASAVMAFPLMVRSMRLSFAAVDERLKQVASTLGAGRCETFVRVTLPLASRGIIAGTVLAFARCLGEFGATIMLAGNVPGETQTISLFIYSQANSPGGLEQSAPLVVAAVAIAAGAMAISEWLQRGGNSHV